MSYAVDYRPQTFDEVCGNKTTVEILKHVIENKKFKNMLLCGQSGGGKTTLARIVSIAINGSLDGTIELDCASNNSVDDVRAIIDSAQERSLVSEYKIFILDECHMLTIQAWNALLKLLEDCPKYTLLFFCTTDELKIPQTVRNRLQRYTISKIPADEIKNRLLYVCKNEGLTNYENACDMISKMCDGSLREALTDLEKCADYSHDLSTDNITAVLGDLSYKTMFSLTWALTKKDEKGLFEVIDKLDSQGQDLKHFIEIYTKFILDLIKYILFNDINLTSIPEYLAAEDNNAVKFTVDFDNNLEYFNKLTEVLLTISCNARYDNAIKTTIIVSLIKFMRG